ncbi:hypothetical protein SAMN02745216_04942 [Desulfatibacillum alkenivorans DSM 16219]|jgi:hypothetical protein|uniref:Uncharacterized protein n=1 Tax=Desulfatibacillum alkenivorans DSM 16219 TaxID=1121393 RepID=A0A1M6ZD22_9BACT|nr:hypothetical protein [Desulfatibacillum alkenivorans]SHL28243.1 hypothetical protein SAMN02745216_04942 [Desulfatibacillum alkenivorans DSM 16219]
MGDHKDRPYGDKDHTDMGDLKDRPYAGAASTAQYRQEKGQAKGGIPAD